ncbi:MAG: isoprenyl transferase [bacterium]
MDRPNSLDFSRLPHHIAIIMDGNGRWAQQRGLSRVQGHREGAVAVRRVVEECAGIGVPVLTLYAFSTENWSRPEEEISALFFLLKEYLQKELATLQKNGIRLRIIGDAGALPPDVRREIAKVETTTALNTGLLLVLAINYGGREDILQAARRLAQRYTHGDISAEDFNEENFERELYTGDLPEPDLLIRTSREFRLSNFLLWQCAYTEFYVTPTLWPDFGVEELHAAIREYQGRERRFGRVPVG